MTDLNSIIGFGFCGAAGEPALALPWALDEAVALCGLIETIAPAYGCHVALTGGTLYKEGLRKDVDIMFYRIRQAPKIDREGLIDALQHIGLTMTTRHGWVQKALYQGKSVDLFFPDYVDGTYDEDGEYA